MNLYEKKTGEQCIITIDGPAGAGKSTISRILAKKIGFFYLDTGAMYRAVALKTKDMGVDLEDEKSIAKLCLDLDLKFDNSTDPPRVILDNKDISSLIRTPEMDMLSSSVSALAPVREAMVKLQRKQAKLQGKIVAEGRDMGTVVFPDASIKFFLTASAKERAYRRYQERLSKGEDITLEKVEKELLKRDKQDQTRKIAPLRPAEDAILIDTTGIGIEEVIDMISEHLRIFDERKGSADA